MPFLTASISTHSLADLRQGLRFLSAALKCDPNGQPYRQEVTDFGVTLDVTYVMQRDLDDAVVDAMAEAVFYNRSLDLLAHDLWTAINGNAALTALFFGSSTVDEFVAPTSESKLIGARAWPALLAKATHESLHALAARAAEVVAGSNAAAKNLDAALSAQERFPRWVPRDRLPTLYDKADRCALAVVYEKFNEVCTKVHDRLKELQVLRPDLKLPPDYADTFFMNEPRTSSATTVTPATAIVNKLQRKLGGALPGRLRHEADAACTKAKALAMVKVKASREAKV